MTRSPGWCCISWARSRNWARPFTAEGYRFEVIDLDGRRIDKVLVSQAAG
jgi:CBS domain containing-hemolysin-like protein